MLVLSYVTKINVISVGHYMNGLFCNNMQLCLNQILPRQGHNISINKKLCVYFHNIGLPLQRMINGNHFGYIEPILEPPFVMTFNTIQAVDQSEIREIWTEYDIIELYKCYYLAKNTESHVKEETYNIWRKRNPTIRKEMTSENLKKKRVLFQNRLTQSQKNNIFQQVIMRPTIICYQENNGQSMIR